MAQVNLADYKNIYLETAKEYLGQMSISLDLLSADISNKEALNNLHIASHSLKGQSQVMGFERITNLSANLEKISTDIQNGIGIVDDKFLILLKNSINEINVNLVKVEKGESE